MIYLLEDDDSIRKLVVYGLQSQGYEAQGFALPSEFWRAMDAQLPLNWDDKIWSTGSYSDAVASEYIPGYYDESSGIDTRDAVLMFPGGSCAQPHRPGSSPSLS